MRFSEFFIKICKICLYIVLQDREENVPSLRQVSLLNRTADLSVLHVNITCIYRSISHIFIFRRSTWSYCHEWIDLRYVYTLCSIGYLWSHDENEMQINCSINVIFHRHEMTQNVHNFSMCRANAISRMLYVNSVQLRIDITHGYPIETLSQISRYSRKLQKTESYIISNELYKNV